MTRTESLRLTLEEIGARYFEVVEHGRRYRMAVPGANATFDLDRAQWTKNELNGELTVAIDMAGTDAIDGILTTANFNVSSARARTERAELIKRQANAAELPWHPILEAFCQAILKAEREGQPSVDLRSIEKPVIDPEVDCHGVLVPMRHPSILFGDGGGMKSYLGLFIAGELRRIGYRVGYFDWEMVADDHRVRLELLYGDDMPEVRYVRCERPLVYEVDRLRRIAECDGLDFAVYDSVAFACDGPPEDAVSAARYFQSTRQIRIGGLHIAHITKSDSKADSGDQKPFGSAFWHNGARATWFVKPGDTTTETVSLGLFPRKRNLGKLPAALGFEFTFAENRTHLRRCNLTDVAELADRLPVRQRLQGALRHGAKTIAELSEELGVPANTITVTVNRGADGARRWLTKVKGADGLYRIGLLAGGR